MNGPFTAKELAEIVGVSRRRIYQLAKAGVLERSEDGLFDRSAFLAYTKYLRRSVAKYSGATRGNPSAKPKKDTRTPEQKAAAIQRLAAIFREMDELAARMSRNRS